ncbi:MAG: dicarboxylate/amino acid:cation symporter [Prevotella sp.]|nr:dicarboxylate/amino acid:cation symporter [Prevotella sp.]MBQ9532938.1 dicarboxylate/amino acid:cation symporter [Prevotella sp.]
MNRMKKIGLLPRIIVAIVLGIILGNVLGEPWVRGFVTFNGIFSQFLGFMIPLIIVGLVTPAIADIGRGVGRLLLLTVAIAYGDTVCAGLLAYGTGSWLFPDMVARVTESGIATEKAPDLLPYFTVTIPAILDVMAALVFAFMMGLGIAYLSHSPSPQAVCPPVSPEEKNSPQRVCPPVSPAEKSSPLKAAFAEFRTIIEKTIAKAIIPLLPLYIFGIFLKMTYTGEVDHILRVFAQIIVVIFALHLFILLYQFCLAGAVVRKNPLKLLWNMLPAYMTALGTSSSAATIPVTLRQTMKNGVSEDIAGFTVPLCATIHMSGSAMKITACALTICLLEGMPHSFPMFLHFILMLGIVMVAAPGVPGGAIMAALAPLSSILGFSAEAQALMIALYIAMDSFGTACNVTGDGAIALVVERWR